MSCEYDLIDRFLRNNLDDCDYAEYSAALDALASHEAASSEKRAPVQGLVGGIPWSLHLEAYAAYSKKWSPQPALIDLEGRGCRGGFGLSELDEFIPGWRERISERTAMLAEIAKLKVEAEAQCVRYSEVFTSYHEACVEIVELRNQLRGCPLWRYRQSTRPWPMRCSRLVIDSTT